MRVIVAGSRSITELEAAAVAASGGGLIAVSDGVSRGTQRVIACARQPGLAVYLHRYPRQ